MATFVIGDIQGCAYSLEALLEKLGPSAGDQIWFAGDLVNRGQHSLRALELVQSLNAGTVLGNHDLHLLARSFGLGPDKNKDTLDDCLAAPKKWRDWLLAQPLVASVSDFTLVHAGLYWDSETSLSKAQATMSRIRANPEKFFESMYGNHPRSDQEAQTAVEADRFVVNACTRMRVLDGDALNLKFKGELADRPAGTQAWFERLPFEHIVFGHWAALEILEPKPQVYATDTGCVWGERLSAICLETGTWTHQTALEKDLV